ncbi:hypothetical protein ANO14919_057820 [Xylariales sp. No.14919]|nr:hypothetical protein ANO14919_057820 [Xylariales sp. No.14919]
MFGFGGRKNKRGQYEKIDLEHGDDTGSPKDSGAFSDERSTGATDSSSIGVIRFYRHVIMILTGVNVLMSFATVWLGIAFTKRVPYQIVKNDVELVGPAEVPVEMELYRFQTGVRESTPFFGPPNATTDAAWGTILNAGLIKLTPEQADALSAPTAKDQQDSTSYVGILEVFHQLHCLNTLRLRAFATDPEVQFADPGHTAHCFEYIRQSLMCLADVNIAPISWNERKREYAIHWDATRQCRNFDKIHAWALDKNHKVSEDV